MYPQGETSDFTLETKSEMVDASAQMSPWTEPVMGMRSWSGSASVYYKGTDWWLRSAGGCTTENPSLIYFYPAQGTGTEYWYGIAYSNWSLKVPKGGMLEQNVSFTGVGPLVYSAS